MPWRGKKDVERHNKKCSRYEPCCKLWLKTANKYYKETGDDGQAVIRANVAAKKWLLSHGKYRRNADAGLQQLRRIYAQDRSFENAMKLASALLRTGTLSHFRELALAGDVEAHQLIRYMRAVLLGESLFSEIEDIPGNPGFIPIKQITPMPYETKYINVYCGQSAYASVTVYLVDDAINIIQTLRNFYLTQNFLPPPDPAEALRSGVARMLGKDRVMTLGVYSADPCQIRIAIEKLPCFDFGDEESLPVHERRGHRNIQIREITDDDFYADERGMTTYKQIEYDDLPDFAKPVNQEGIPTYVVANLVTRGQVNDIDGPAWQNFFEPVAKVYVGYLINYLHTQPSGWEWGDEIYTYTCHHTEEAARDFRNTLDVDEGVNVVELPGRLLSRLDPCPLAGVPQFITERPRRPRCVECNNDVDLELHQTRHLLLRADAPPGTPEPPQYVNVLLDLLQRLYQRDVHGDIYSVLGGQDLSVGLKAGSYGPFID